MGKGEDAEKDGGKKDKGERGESDPARKVVRRILRMLYNAGR